MITQLATTSKPLPIPLPSVNITIRPGVLSDVPFMDSLQKLHTKQVGWMPTKQFEGKIKAGHVLVAVVATPASPSAIDGQGDAGVATTGERVGYCIGNDQYFKRDDVGIIYQMNVLPGRQRGLIGASLLKAQFERSAYGCRLYCCWCAQDIAANKFWEAMGFVPLAYRAGSEKKGPKGPTGSRSPRVHIFWQKRIRQGDTTTPWWFPSKTAGGSIREDRIVVPIPPGTHWSDAKPLILPALSGVEGPEAPKALNHEATKQRSKPKTKSFVASSLRGEPALQPRPIKRNGLMFDIPKQGEPLPPIDKAQGREAKPAKEPKPKAPKVKRTCDPRLVSAARELRDRWLEQVNSGQAMIEAAGKYEVSKPLGVRPHSSPLLEAEGAKALLPAA